MIEVKLLGMIVKLPEMTNEDILFNDKLLLCGTQIAYLPPHIDPGMCLDIEEALQHPDVEFGFVVSGPCSNGDYFCRYWRKGHLGDLRTKSCSERTPAWCIVSADVVAPEIVTQALADYC